LRRLSFKRDKIPFIGRLSFIVLKPHETIGGNLKAFTNLKTQLFDAVLEVSVKPLFYRFG